MSCHDIVPVSAEAAFKDGNYLLAATIAEAKNSAAALSFAARARIADAVTRKESCIECLQKAEATAEAAIRSASTTAAKSVQAEAYVQLAIAIGFRARLMSAMDAQAESLPEKGRAAIDKALEFDPVNPWALAALGGWHLEIVRRAGPVLAETLYGANEHEGLDNFRRAIKQDPANFLLRYQFALSILALDFEEHRVEAIGMLTWNDQDAPTDAVAKFTRARARQLTQLLFQDSKDQVEATVREFQGYPPKD